MCGGVPELPGFSLGKSSARMHLSALCPPVAMNFPASLIDGIGSGLILLIGGIDAKLITILQINNLYIMTTRVSMLTISDLWCDPENLRKRATASRNQSLAGNSEDLEPRLQRCKRLNNCNGRKIPYNY